MMPKEPLILLVEDDPDHTELVLECLRENKIETDVVHMSDGQTAMDYLFGSQDSSAEPGARPHLILLDLRLPKVDGITVLSRIKACKELESIPVIVLTTSSAQHDLSLAYRNHANSYLVKPIDFRAFAKMFRDLESYWLGWNRIPRG